MAGQATSGRSISATMSDISSVKLGGVSGISGSDNSAIGGMGRKGGAGEGPETAPYKDVCSLGQGGGNATTGQTGYSSGSGKTL